MSDTPMEERARTVILRDLDRANARIAELEAEVNHLQGENDRLRDVRESRIAELEEALRPFAELLSPKDWERVAEWQHPDTATWSAELNVVDLKAAIAALAHLTSSSRIAELEAERGDYITETEALVVRVRGESAARITELEAERNKWSDTAGSWMERAVLAEAERDALVKEHIRQTDSNLKLIRERDRLKATLTKIANQHTEAEREKEGIEEEDCDFVGAWDAIVEDARATLSGEEMTT